MIECILTYYFYIRLALLFRDIFERIYFFAGTRLKYILSKKIWITKTLKPVLFVLKSKYNQVFFYI